MEGLFLAIWFYIYAGLMFAMVSHTVGFFPKTGWFVQMIGWPIFSVIAFIRQSNVKEKEG
jgi:hypothetical protein